MDLAGTLSTTWLSYACYRFWYCKTKLFVQAPSERKSTLILYGRSQGSLRRRTNVDSMVALLPRRSMLRLLGALLCGSMQAHSPQTSGLQSHEESNRKEEPLIVIAKPQWLVKRLQLFQLLASSEATSQAQSVAVIPASCSMHGGQSVLNPMASRLG